MRSHKKRRLDNIDVLDEIATTRAISEVIADEHAALHANRYFYTYWDSPECKKLFRPLADETVIGCLKRRNNLFLNATRNDVALLNIVDGVSNISDLSEKQKEHIRIQCLYLR